MYRLNSVVISSAEDDESNKPPLPEAGQVEPGSEDFGGSFFCNVDLLHQEDDPALKKNKEDQGDEELDEENSDMGAPVEDDLSASYKAEDESSIDLVEKKEKEIRYSLLFCILSACGMLFCMNMIGKLLARFSNGNNPEEDVADMVVDEAVGTTRDVALNSSMNASTFTGNQTMMYVS